MKWKCTDELMIWQIWFDNRVQFDNTFNIENCGRLAWPQSIPSNCKKGLNYLWTRQLNRALIWHMQQNGWHLQTTYLLIIFFHWEQFLHEMIYIWNYLLFKNLPCEIAEDIVFSLLFDNIFSETNIKSALISWWISRKCSYNLLS